MAGELLVGEGVLPVCSPRLLRGRKLAAPFKKTIASPRSYYLVQSASAARKPEVQEFAAWLREEASAATAAGPGSSAPADRARA